MNDVDLLRGKLAGQRVVAAGIAVAEACHLDEIVPFDPAELPKARVECGSEGGFRAFAARQEVADAFWHGDRLGERVGCGRADSCPCGEKKLSALHTLTDRQSRTGHSTHGFRIEQDADTTKGPALHCRLASLTIVGIRTGAKAAARV